MTLLKLFGMSWPQFGNFLFRRFALGIDVTDAPSQDAIADTLVAPLEESTEAAENPAEEAVVTEGEEPTNQEAATEQAEEEEVADDWLPTQQEKVFPDETLAKYAKRYGYTLEEIQADPRLHRTLTERLNNDIYIQDLRQREEQAELEQETEKPEPTRQEQPQQQITVEQHLANIRQMVQQRTDPTVAKEFFAGFNRIFGVSDQQIAETLKANPNAALEFTNHMSTFALNLFNSFVPDMVWANLSNMVEQSFPNFGQMYERASYSYTWDALRNSDARFAELPAYGTKEFAAAARKAATEQFGSAEDFENAVFTKVVNGQRVQMSPAENTQKKYSLLANAMLGRRLDPAQVQQAIDTGKKQAAKTATRKDAGNLGSGRSKQTIAQPEKDDLFAQGMELYRQEHGRL